MERMFAPLCASVSVQTGVIAAATGHPVPAAVLCGTGTAVITWRRSTSGWQEQPAAPGGRVRRNALVIGLSTILTIGGLMPYLALDAGFGRSGAGAGHGPADATAPVFCLTTSYCWINVDGTIESTSDGGSTWSALAAVPGGVRDADRWCLGHRPCPTRAAVVRTSANAVRCPGGCPGHPSGLA